MATADQHPATADLTIAEARALQERMRNCVETDDRFGAIHRIAGVDVAYGGRRGPACAAVVVLNAQTLAVEAQAKAVVPCTFPYVPGLLSFREAPAVVEALGKLTHPPELLICDGQGVAHPRRCGLACHLGVILDIPSIGLAKSRLIGTHDDPGPERGDHVRLYDRGDVIGAVLRTRAGTRPLYVSSGHRVSLPTAIAWALRLTPRYRLPETTRQSDRLSKLTAAQWRICNTLNGR